MPASQSALLIHNDLMSALSSLWPDIEPVYTFIGLDQYTALPRIGPVYVSTWHWTSLRFYLILDQSTSLPDIGPVYVSTWYWTSLRLYLILDQSTSLPDIGPVYVSTWYWTSLRLYLILDQSTSLPDIGQVWVSTWYQTNQNPCSQWRCTGPPPAQESLQGSGRTDQPRQISPPSACC